eukprot:TRINITY_DN18722_c0_g1_i1.p1 TRINITY_DN18722_c0_g1~~TRINITY_DN18722_c0_g1_i1.p1  ORF type:complete len:656 (+),score=186.47 TRINITY_DN18722_c0_g1_i1:154-2121(+)
MPDAANPGGADGKKEDTKPKTAAELADEAEAQAALEEKVRKRLEDSGTGTGLPDWVFNAAPLVEELRDVVEPQVQGFRLILEAIVEAAELLTDDQWQRFVSIPFTRIHKQDQEMHTSVFSKTEPDWKKTMTMPKTGKTCVFLFIGTAAPGDTLCKLFTRLGWFGVSVTPTPPSGYGDSISSFEMDPGSHKDDEEFAALMKKRGGKVPKPELFPLVYVNLHFSPDVVESDSEEDDPVEPHIKQRMDDFFQYDHPDLQRARARSPQKMSREETPEPAKPTGRGAHEVTHFAGMSQVGSGYGLLGVTRTVHVRRRLRAIRNSLATGLNRLGDKGTMIICWPGLPFHPVLLSVCNYLRGLFLRVHIVIQENSCMTWEIYILCTSFSRSAQTEANPSEGGGSALKSFMDSNYRRNGVDDVLLWTLTNSNLNQECRNAGGEKKGITKTYDDIWTAYSRKLRSLMMELMAENNREMPVLPVEKEAKPGKKEKPPPEPKAKPKPKREPRERKVKEDEPESPVMAQPKAKSRPKSAAKAKPEPKAAPVQKKEKLPMVVEVKQEKKKKKEELPPEEEEKPALTMEEVLARATTRGVGGKDYTKLRDLNLSRSLPNLACTFGASPGLPKNMKKKNASGNPDPRCLGVQFPLIKFGFKKAQEAALFG